MIISWSSFPKYLNALKFKNKKENKKTVSSLIVEFLFFSFYTPNCDALVCGLFAMQEKKQQYSLPIEWTHKINFECIFAATIAMVWCRILFDCFIPCHLKIEIGFKIELKMDWKLLNTCAKIAVFIFFPPTSSFSPSFHNLFE